MAKQQGFTLVELIITVAVIAIVVAIAIPNFQSILNSSRLRGDVNEVVAALNYARAEAIKCRGDVTFNIQGSPWELVVDSEVCEVRRLEGEGRLGVSESADVRFDRLGRAPDCSGGGCTVDISGRSIVVFSSGYIEL